MQAFNNILDVAYPPSSSNPVQEGPLGVEPLGALSARALGANIEVFIDGQLQDEFDY